jgi:hypothetical protein
MPADAFRELAGCPDQQWGRLFRFYSTFGNCGHFAPHGSFMLRAIFFGQSAVISPSQCTGEG